MPSRPAHPRVHEGTWTNHEPRRTRKLLLHRGEIERLIGKTREGGLTLVPLPVYFSDGKVKVELALAKGKKPTTSASDLAKRDAEREIPRAYGRAAKGRVRSCGIPAPPPTTRTSRAGSPSSGCPDSSTCTCISCRRGCWARSGPTSTDAERTTARPGRSTTGTTSAERLALLRELGVRAFAPLVYPHKPGMAALAHRLGHSTSPPRTPGRRPVGDVLPRARRRASTSGRRSTRGARVFKVHVQVGGFDPRDPLLRPGLGRCWPRRHAGRWCTAATARVPRRAHRGRTCSARCWPRTPRLVLVVAHAGMPDYLECAELADRYPRVHLDTTMVGTAFSRGAWPRCRPTGRARLADLGDRVVLGTDFPNIPYPYAEQLTAVARLGRRRRPARAGFLRSVLHDTPARLLGEPDERRVARRYPHCGARAAGPEGVNGFDSGCRSRGSVPRKATMISLTTRRKPISAADKRTALPAQAELALAA